MSTELHRSGVEVNRSDPPPSAGTAPDVVTNDQPADPRPPRNRRGKWRRSSLEHLLAVIAIIASVVTAYFSIVISQRASDKAIAYQEKVRQQAQAERVVFVETSSQIIQNYSALPILDLQLEVQGKKISDGIIVEMSSLGPCEQIDTQAVWPYTTQGTKFVRMRFTDASDRVWVRELDGDLSTGAERPEISVKVDPDFKGTLLIPPAVSEVFKEVPREPIKGCVPG
jgi:hypothetical protein